MASDSTLLPTPLTRPTNRLVIMSKLDDLYELTVITAVTKYYIVNDFATLEKVYVSWRDATFDNGSKITVKGFADDAMRSPIEISVDSSLIQSMMLSKM